MDRKQALALANTLRVAREELGDIALMRLETLLRVAAGEGQAQIEIGKAMKIGKTVISQNVLNLTDVTSKQDEGPGVVEQRINPTERRMRTIHLTAKGRTVLNRLDRALHGRR